MSSNKNYFDLIDSYLNGEMSKGQINEFEKQLRQDPLLENEFQLQKDIVESIQHFRHAELKATLDAVEVGGTAFSGIKVAAGIGLLALLGAGIYYFGTSDKSKDITPTVAEQEVTTPKEEANDIVENTAEAIDTKANNEEVTENISIIEKVDEDEKSTKVLATSPKDNDNVATKQQEIVDAPDITLPEVVENFNETNDNQIAENINVPVNKMQQATETYIPKTAVVEVEDKKYAFHYQFYDNKLYLYGDFENKYEILELNTPKGISIYMFYNAQFYELKQDQEEITPLESIKDETLIEDLNTIKEN